jgi:hypothetical protein
VTAVPGQQNNRCEGHWPGCGRGDCLWPYQPCVIYAYVPPVSVPGGQPDEEETKPVSGTPPASSAGEPTGDGSELMRSNIDPPMKAGGACGEHGLYDGRACPKCRESSERGLSTAQPGTVLASLASSDEATVREESERVAQAFHEAYERLAPQFGYETRRESAVPWSEVPDANKRLMVAVSGEVLAALSGALQEQTRLADSAFGKAEQYLQAAKVSEDGLALCRERKEAAEDKFRALTAALEGIAANAEDWHGPPPDMGHVRALAVIATTARSALDQAACVGGETPAGGA